VIEATVQQTKDRSGWTVVRILQALGLSRSTYYEASGGSSERSRMSRQNPFAVLPQERAVVVRYALEHPEVRHRELAWRMVDEDVAYVSPSTVYRILLADGLVCRWQRPEKQEKPTRAKPTHPDEAWQSDLRYVRVGRRWYYLLTFLDECSRYVVHHALVRWMDGDSVSVEAQAAIEKLGGTAHPTIQTDHGSSFISGEFKLVLTQNGIGHQLIHPHCPQENGLVERLQRTLGEKIDEHELREYYQATEVIDRVIRWYNEQRLHSGIAYLRPVDVYRGEPEKILEGRRRKLATARQRRKEDNLKLRQRRLDLEGSTRSGNRTLSQPAICPS
jgi:transposase InsO family protein